MALPKTYCLEDLEREAALCNFLVLTHDLEVALGGGEDLSSSAFPSKGLVNSMWVTILGLSGGTEQPRSGAATCCRLVRREDLQSVAGTHCLTVLRHVVLHCEKTVTMSR